MDEELRKDLYIKEKLEKDKLISKKADDLFNNFFNSIKNNEGINNDNVVSINTTKISENIDKKIYESNSSENQNIKYNNIENNDSEKNNIENENNSKVVSINSRRKRFLATVASLAIILVGANAYATTKGYGNIFFLIKDLVINQDISIAGKENILVDRDLTISYEQITISNGVTIQINKLVVKDNNAVLKLRISTTREARKIDSFTVKDITPKITGGTQRVLANKKYVINPNSTENIDINLNGFTDNTNILELDLIRNNKVFSELKIDLDEKLIEILSNDISNDLEKISEIELKETLSKYAKIIGKDEKNAETNLSEKQLNIRKFEVAMEYINEKRMKNTINSNSSNGNNSSNNSNNSNNNSISNDTINNNNNYNNDGVNTEATDTEITNTETDDTNTEIGYTYNEVNEFMKEFLNDSSDEPLDLPDDYLFKYNEKTKKYEVINAGDTFTNTLCLKIEDISYENGIYSVKFDYCYPGEGDLIDGTIDNLNVYQSELNFRLNTDYKYTKYQVIDSNSMIRKEIEFDNIKIEDLKNTNTISKNDISNIIDFDDTNTNTLNSKTNTNTIYNNVNKNNTVNNKISKNTTKNNNVVNNNVVNNNVVNNKVSNNSTVNNTVNNNITSNSTKNNIVNNNRTSNSTIGNNVSNNNNSNNTILYGDADLDGRITISDSVTIKQYVAGNRELSETALKNADVNIDGKVDDIDALIIDRRMARWTEYQTLPYTGKITGNDINLNGEKVNDKTEIKYNEQEIKEVVEKYIAINFMYDATLTYDNPNDWYKNLPYNEVEYKNEEKLNVAFRLYEDKVENIGAKEISSDIINEIITEFTGLNFDNSTRFSPLNVVRGNNGYKYLGGDSSYNTTKRVVVDSINSINVLAGDKIEVVFRYHYTDRTEYIYEATMYLKEYTGNLNNKFPGIIKYQLVDVNNINSRIIHKKNIKYKNI